MLSSLLGAHNRVGKGPMSRELCFSTAIELARRIRAREVSVTEVVQAHLAQIERVNPKVNAIVTLTAERALAEGEAEQRLREAFQSLAGDALRRNNEAFATLAEAWIAWETRAVALLRRPLRPMACSHFR